MSASPQSPTTVDPDQLRARWAALTESEGQLRTRNAAQALGVSEAQLVATGCGNGVTRLEIERWADLIKELNALGHVMALTRNEHLVIENDGHYQNINCGDAMGQVVDEGIDLRLFFRHWGSAFAVERETPRGMLRSIQIFGRTGDAVHKVYLRKKSDLDAYQALVERLRSDDQSSLQPVEEPAPKTTEQADASVDVSAFQKGWLDMTNTHEFYGLLLRHKVSRTQALRLAPEGMVESLEPIAALHQVLSEAAKTELPIMIFVGNPACLQIFTGVVRKLVASEPWYNVMDPGFNLHVHEPGLDRAYIVRKPTSDGIVTAVEFYNTDDEVIAWFFGERKPGREERNEWRTLVDALPRLEG